MRVLDLVIAALLMLLSAIVIYDALRIGAGWGSEGPQSGFFPFWLATLLAIVSVVLFVQALLSRSKEPFVTRERFMPVLKVLGPLAGFVVLTDPPGPVVRARPLCRGGFVSRLLHALGRAPRLADRRGARHRGPRHHIFHLRDLVSGAHAQGAGRGLVRVLTVGPENLFLGFQVAVTPFNLFIAVVGILLGTVIGVLPGLGGANGVAILLPLTFTMPPTSAIILLTSIYWGALFGGAITSVLFNIPGEPWSVATTFDGYPLAKDGRSGEALTAAFTSSFVGALFSIVLITFFAPLLAEVALKFGPPEFFAIQLLTFSSFVGLGGGNPLKSLATILIGFMLSTVGLDIVTGQLRLTYGFTDLMKGFDFIIAVIGLFGIGEILLSVEEGLRFQGSKDRNEDARRAGYLENFTALLPDIHTQLHHRILDGFQARRCHTGVLHELCFRQALFKKSGAIRQGRDRRHRGAGDRRPCGRGRGHVADDYAWHPRARRRRR